MVIYIILICVFFFFKYFSPLFFYIFLFAGRTALGIYKMLKVYGLQQFQYEQKSTVVLRAKIEIDF